MLKNWLEVAATNFDDLFVYWFPAGLPFLKLGETKFYTGFSVTRMDSVRAGLLRGWKEPLVHATECRVANAEQMLQSLDSSPVQTIKLSGRGHSVYLRLPLLMCSKQEKEALCRVSVEQGLGVSSVYPSSVQNIPELREKLSSQDNAPLDNHSEAARHASNARIIVCARLDEFVMPFKMFSGLRGGDLRARPGLERSTIVFLTCHESIE